MGARQRINSLYFAGVLILSATIGVASSSLNVFLFTACFLVGLLLHSGDIRMKPTSMPDGQRGIKRSSQKRYRRSRRK